MLTTPVPSLQRIVILGSTGSIGTQTLDIVRLFPERLQVAALTAGNNAELLIQQALEFQPELVVIGSEERREDVESGLRETGISVLVGEEGLQAAATLEGSDTVVAALVGFVGLSPTLAAVRAHKRIALANKETLVVAGELFQEETSRHGVDLLPVDSEHSAIFQCLVGEDPSRIEELLLTASGGPFRTLPLKDFASITREQALRHPNWSMGSKITIDSATMMNKGLEIIEARWMFDVEPDRIRVVVHPQSIVHSMVGFVDGSVKAQLGLPDMKVPIQYALSFPERWSAPHGRVDFMTLGSLDFEPPDVQRFPCLQLAYDALELGGTAPALLNAANEVAVQLFLEERIRFVDIPRSIEMALKMADTSTPDLDTLKSADSAARTHVKELHGMTIH